ncbi:CDK5 and ABL1 enzyme substrate 1-like [Actinia tenebrosa]|uniref:CDK5 and ABL1 enzyme substrate 1-like n=1 Tax=Actinia tenebrosa TaxID=6105 RepID=A0A6P8J498_ACTTE|nr:CDK5 and ABL1 enzyme substrate 1-like [Actinia tenebrosa]
MAAVAVAAAAGQTSRRKSRRALAQSFLSRISLDGNIVQERNEPTSGPGTPLMERELPKNVAEQKTLVTAVQSVAKTIPNTKAIPHTKPKYMHSFSENAASFERDKPRITRSKDSESMICNKTLTPETVGFRRSCSATESLMTESSSSFSGSVHFNRGTIRHKITCMSGSSFKLRRKLHDKRIVLCSPRKVPFLTYSVLKYHHENKEVGVEGTGRKRASAPNNQYLGIEGVEVGTGDKTVSYSSLLVPSFTNVKYVVGDAKDGIPLLMPPIDSPIESCFDELEYPGSMVVDRYEPYKLDDPELTSGKHRTVLKLSSYMVSVTAYAKPSELKKDLNERFREKFPYIDITLTKLRSLKKDLLKIALSLDCQLDLTTVAYAYVYFEKLILKGKINKPNRKLIAGSCLLLAAKFNDDKRVRIKDLIDKIEDKLKIQVKELLLLEFQALVGLEFNLHVPTWEVIPHLRRLETEMQ